MRFSVKRVAANGRLFKKLLLIAVLMFGFGYAMVPFYEAFCRITGINDLGKPDQLSNTQVDRTRTITLELDANLRSKLAWTFKPTQPNKRVHPGELVQVEYEVVNQAGRVVTGQAVPSYAPRVAERYVKKLECFCFRQQTFKAGERRRMPVVFVLDPALPPEISTVTLSYTFFEVEGGAK